MIGRWFRCLEQDGFMYPGYTFCVLRAVVFVYEFEGTDCWEVGLPSGWTLHRTSERLLNEHYYTELTEEEATAFQLGVRDAFDAKLDS